MSVSSYPDVFNAKDFARRNLWEATLCTFNSNTPMIAQGLISSVSVPKLSFEVSDIAAGSAKGYTGWKLPDNIKMTVLETADHAVEKALDEWMVGRTLNLDNNRGVFSRRQGTLCAGNYRNLYRTLRVKTFTYKPDTGSTVHFSATKKQFRLSSRRSTQVREFKARRSPTTVIEKQVIPVLDKFTALGGQLINNAVAKVPVSSNLTKTVIPTVVIPPLLMKRAKLIGAFSSALGDSRIDKQQVLHDSPYSEDERQAFQWDPPGLKEEITSRMTYTVAIVGYDVGTYDYQKGDCVSYDIDLAVIDIFYG